MKSCIISLALWLCGAVGIAQAQEAVSGLTIGVSGADASTGQVLIALFDNEADYMTTPLAEFTIPVDEQGNASVLVPELTPGDYALAVIYDRDGNGKLNTGLFGIPTEKVGFSNNARGRMGPASWESAHFNITEENTVMAISLSKPKRN